MSDALVALAIAVPAGLICPGVALWRSRRGQAAACCAPASADQLRRRQERLAAEIAAYEPVERRSA